MNYETREQWLEHAVTELSTAVFPEYELPDGIRISCGFPSTKALSPTKRRIGECWKREASDGGQTIHVFVSPIISDANEVLGIVSHELIHALRPESKHNGPFKRIATSIGLVGKMTATVAGPELLARFKPILETLGDYPHVRLIPLGKEPKTQTTRLIKAECPCGSTIRITRKWIDVYKGELPHCPCGGQFTEAIDKDSE